MSLNPERSKGISRSMLHMFFTFMELDNQTHFYGTDVEIYPAEIHILSEIARHPGIHIMGLAEMRSVTKGNASQVTLRLEKKGLIERRISKTNQSKLSLYVTEKGMTAHQHHMDYHEKLDALFALELENASEDNVRFLENFIRETMKNVKDLEKEL